MEMARIEPLCRLLAEAAGHNPDLTIQAGVPYQVGEHQFFNPQGPALPLWRAYVATAADALSYADKHPIEDRAEAQEQTHG